MFLKFKDKHDSKLNILGFEVLVECRILNGIYISLIFKITLIRLIIELRRPSTD